MSGIEMSYEQNVLDFLTRSRIDAAAATGDPDHRKITTQFRFLDIKDRDWDGEVLMYTIQNSHLNRRLNIVNPAVLIDKIRYAIEIIAGVADLGIIPVSYIYSLEKYLKQLCLYMKDRGHIIHVLANLSAIKLNKANWSKVIEELGDGRGSSRMLRVIDHIEKTVNKMSNDKLISVKDMIGAEMNQRLLDLEVTVRISIESLDNHVREMDKINNSNNKWTPHNYGMLELRSLDGLVTPRINVDTIYDAVLRSSVLQSQEQFLLAREKWCRENAGHEDEVVYYFLGAWNVWDADDTDFEARWGAYEKVNDIALRKRLYTTIYDNNEDTDSILELIDFINSVGKCSDWRRLTAHITKVANLQEKGTTNLKALTPAQQRSAMKYLDLIKVLMKKTKWGSNTPALVKMVVDEAIKMLTIPKGGTPMDNKLLVILKEDGTTANLRHKYFFYPLYKKVLAEIKGNKPQRSGRASKTDKLAILSGVLAEGDMPTSFTVMDRVREDHHQITTINLITGDGFELGHIKAGTSDNEENIFLQFKKDNKFNSAFDITPEYWSDYLTWATRVYKELEVVSTEDEEAYQNTLQFCTLMTQYGQLI